MRVQFCEWDGKWYWCILEGTAGADSLIYYTRRSDAIRGFRRFQAAIAKVTT